VQCQAQRLPRTPVQEDGMRHGTCIVHVIDDDEAVRESLEALLIVSGFAVETYGSAEEYLAVADAADGCLLLDIHMPGMGGLDLLQELAHRQQRLPVLVLTATRKARLKERALELGAIAVLTKPVPEAALVEALRRANSGNTAIP
jgi:two-component system response regulator FixJ